MGLKPNPLDLSSFSALTLLVGSFDRYFKPVPDMTYNVFGGTLSLTLSTTSEQCVKQKKSSNQFSNGVMCQNWDPPPTGSKDRATVIRRLGQSHLEAEKTKYKTVLKTMPVKNLSLFYACSRV